MTQDLEENKQNAIAFYKMTYEGEPRKAVELYVGDEYVQHNPLVGDGKEPLIGYFERMAKEYPDKSIMIQCIDVGRGYFTREGIRGDKLSILLVFSRLNI